MDNTLIGKIDRATALKLKDQIAYQEGGISSLSLTYSKQVDITLLALDKGEKLATHSADGDALATILEGEVEIIVDGISHILKEGESILMPVHIPHSLKAITPFKFLLIVVYPSITK